MNVLSIGNSFSCDAQRYLNAISARDSNEIYCVNLYIGGCSLETHVENLKADAPAYDFEKNGKEGSRKISIKEAVELCKWDVVTLQQVSGKSGIKESFEPYLGILFDYVKKSLPEAKIYFHETWAYDVSSAHPDFVYYNNDRDYMQSRIKQTYEYYSKKYGVEILPVGEVIQHFRKNVEPFCDGVSLTRDSFHLSFTYGRYIASLVWYYIFTGRDAQKTEYVPEEENVDIEIIKRIRKEISSYFNNR